MSKIIALFVALLIGISSINGQISLPTAIVPEAVDSYRNAEQFLLEKEYKKALKQFEKCLKIQPGLSAAHRGLGICYGLLNDYESAIVHYEIILESDSLYSRALYYELGDAYYKTGLYDRALINFQAFKDLQIVDIEAFGIAGEREIQRELEYLSKVDNSIRSTRLSLDAKNFEHIKNIENLGGNINSAGHEYFPYLSNDQQMLFFTRIKKDEEDENLLYSNLNNSGRWKSSTPFKFFNTPAPEGRFTMVRNGRKMYFTACGREGVLGPCDIWEGIIDDGKISDVKAITGALNSMKWESQVSVSCDGGILYFASNREGGVGGTDIWYSKMLEDGTWSAPINAGKGINTPFDEEAPFLTNDGKTLYFSSTGHMGLGDQTDIYMSRINESNGKWDKAVNLGSPLNSPHNDFGFFLCADGKTGYFASDRKNNHFRSNYDIYRFELDEKLYSDPITFVEGYVRDTMYDLPVGGAIVNTRERGRIQTDEVGRFFLCLPANSSLELTVDEEKYDFYENAFNIPQWHNKEFHKIYLDLKANYIPFDYDQVPDTTVITFGEEEKPLEITPPPNFISEKYSHEVFFEFDAFDLIRPEIDEIDAFIAPLLKRKITKVEIIGYADDIGPDTYNLKLSEKRAKQIALYLMENNIVVDKIYLEGRGEIKDDSPKRQNRKVNINIFTQEEK